MSQLDQLKTMTTVVADTGDFQQLLQFKPQDATTNPSLILKAVQQPVYRPLLEQAVASSRSLNIEEVVERLLVRFGCEILSVVPGRVSTEVDARLSFNTPATVASALRLVALYRAQGVDTTRVLIKIAATWEGIQAAAALEQQGIHTNLTLLFSKVQAIACAQAKVQLISPFVGRIYDWHKKKQGAAWDEVAMQGANDPGVQSVQGIYTYFKHFGVKTEIMGASFRNTAQILALSGCDLLTIAPELLTQLQTADASFARALLPQVADISQSAPMHYNEADFRWALNEDAMATEKLAEGIRAFAADTLQLEKMIQAV